MDKANVLFAQELEHFRDRGFRTIGNNQYLHAGYPGMIFVRCKSFADAAANGGALVLYGATQAAAGPWSNKKLLLGADIGYHGFKDAAGNFPKLAQFPYADKTALIQGGACGTWTGGMDQFTTGSPTSTATIWRVIMRKYGTKFVDAPFGAHAVVVSFISRVPRGFVYQLAADFAINANLRISDVLADPLNGLPADTADTTDTAVDMTGAGQKSAPASFNGAAYRLGSQGSPGTTTGVDAYKTVRDRITFPAKGGQIHLGVMTSPPKLLDAGKTGVLLENDAKMRKYIDSAWDKLRAQVPDDLEVPLGVSLSGTLPSAAGQTLTLSAKNLKVGIGISFLLVNKRVSNNTGGFNGTAAAVPNLPNASMSSLVSSYGIWPAGDQATLPLPKFVGEPNSSATGPGAVFDTIPAIDGEAISFHSVPNLRLTGPTGEVIVKSSTLFSQLSPITRPRATEFSVTLEKLIADHELWRSAGFKAGKMHTKESTTEDDPMHYASVYESAEGVGPTLKGQQAEVHDLEPLSKWLANWGSALHRQVLADAGS